MRKYKTARFLARLVIVGGLAGAALMALFAVTQLLTPIGMPFFSSGIGVAFLGVLFALVGYGFIAVFDIAEALTDQEREASNISLKRTDQSLRD
ncbi:hypothetical protein [Microcoleus sp. M2_C2]|uniref:hypothetical protein n=1 Tax=unclassified Microcoleus TaxID=2642155 RepID=UPI002FD0D914